MGPLLIALLLQAPQAPASAVELPVSLERVREALARPKSPFELPPPRPWRRPLFRVTIEEELILDTEPWEDLGIVPPWVRPLAPSHHYEFVSLVTPEEVRSATLYPCCNVTPVIQAVGGLLSKGIRSVRQARAKREVERVMREAGIRK